MIRLLAAVQTRRNTFFHAVQTDRFYTDSGLGELKKNGVTSPGPSRLFNATAQTRSAVVGTMIRLLAAVQTRKNPFFHALQTDWFYTDSGPPEPNKITAHCPARLFLPMQSSVLGGPSPRRGNASWFRRTFEAHGLGAHVARRARTAPPRPRSTAMTSTRSFVSRRHKSRGYPISHTGLLCGQFIFLETSQRLVIKKYVYAHFNY